MAPDAEPKQEGSTVRRDTLLAIQQASQAKWAESNLFVVDAPAADEANPGKYFGNFPYPYMNGLLHLGHAFTISKLEFACAYQRLCGKNVLFPQGFHCTGMPIKACADKLDYELTTYGVPPKFPTEEERAAAAAAAAAADAATNGAAEVKDPTKFAGKKSKAAAKAGTAVTQWGILTQSGISQTEIPRFRSTDHWLEFFPPLAKEHLTLMGCGVDWRRSFITTDMNPYYDSFVRWQFWTLYRLGKIIKDKRNTIYSPLDGQPCADHDRATGEGVGPQDYTLIKLEVQELKGKLSALTGKGQVYLMAATLRPETMYGQTNCWVLPDGQYGAYRGLNDEIYVMTERAALNLSYQEKLPERGQPECLLEVTGQDLIGLPIKAPHAIHPTVYVLPLLTILTTKGTGVVTSVPSDSPDDYMALLDLKKKPKLREKYGVLDEWVLPFEVIPIIDIPGFGDMAAQVVCEELKIQSQNDTAKLAEAKNKVYLKGFTDGVMTVGPYSGRKVSEVKPIIRDEMVANGTAMSYSEPEKQVISRSGDECVVALTDQWYLTYGEDQWQELTKQALSQLDTYHDEARHSFEHTVGWLKAWACSRSFGLGTRMPWDEQFLIESLSDSTIYMAYYTVAHLLQGGDMYGKERGAIRPEHLTEEVWDHIFLDKPAPANSAIPADLLARLKREFEYWYPFDLRVSGKDLITNHLTMALYNHTAIWSDRPDRWPKSIRSNGHLLLNSEKMSKSTGNFKTLHDAIKEFSADAMRWALADAGDGLDDANFETSTANAAILRLTKELAWYEEALAPNSGLREGEPSSIYDRIFENAINIGISKAKDAYDRLLFRDALKAAGYDLSNARDVYRLACGPDGMNKQLVERFIKVSCQLLAPIIPHTSEHVWSNLLKQPGTVLKAGWPQGAPPDFVMQTAAEYIEEIIPSLRKLIQKAEAPAKKKGPTPVSAAKVIRADIFVSDQFKGWQELTLLALQKAYNTEMKKFSPDALNQVVEAVKVDESLRGKSDKEIKAAVLPFAKLKLDEAQAAGPEALATRLPFDEQKLLQENIPYLLRALKLDDLRINHVKDTEAVAAAPGQQDMSTACPRNPVIVFTTATPTA